MNSKKMISHVREGTRLEGGKRVNYTPTSRDARREIQSTRSAEPLSDILALIASVQILPYFLGLMLLGLSLDAGLNPALGVVSPSLYC